MSAELARYWRRVAQLQCTIGMVGLGPPEQAELDAIVALWWTLPVDERPLDSLRPRFTRSARLHVSRSRFVVVAAVENGIRIGHAGPASEDRAAPLVHADP
jgi:hypothetical protein